MGETKPCKFNDKDSAQTLIHLLQGFAPKTAQFYQTQLDEERKPPCCISRYIAMKLIRSKSKGINLP